MPTSDRLRAGSGAVFERILDQALASPEVSRALRPHGRVTTHEDLRARALEARETIIATAAIEYQDYLDLKGASSGTGGEGTASRSAGGILPVLAVFVPSLSAVAAAVFLLCGYGLRALDQARRIGEDLITAGLIAAVAAVGAAVADLVWLFVAAARNRSSAGSPEPGDTDPRVREAWEAWEEALLERGILPFLLGRLELAHMAAETARPDHDAVSRAAGADDDRPERDPQSVLEPGFTPPDYSSPDFTSPEPPSLR
ncbi:hypothetical protein [Streptomyces roseochromogenus]|uniref:Transmembrane protein n=1 Tax=Streptomyces roseochromogenus subsp. oscitans DS 12.976 TaxID=1352936 RepID=V6L626_STRRC|nr:hypothetical protein [Streptomyces roseochromogenus]EST36659.1 hypothetical protein M878_00765 [Streptomyces roseochromogenus subsp. oscitans DS 12.976]